MATWPDGGGAAVGSGHVPVDRHRGFDPIVSPVGRGLAGRPRRPQRAVAFGVRRPRRRRVQVGGRRAAAGVRARRPRRSAPRSMRRAGCGRRRGRTARRFGCAWGSTRGSPSRGTATTSRWRSTRRPASPAHPTAARWWRRRRRWKLQGRSPACATSVSAPTGSATSTSRSSCSNSPRATIRERRFPPLRAVPADGHNLQQPGDAIVGRGDELAALAALVAPGQVVTVCGPGGVGKTRLAVELGLGDRPALARRRVDGGPRRRCLPARPSASAVAEALGLARADDALDAIVDHLRDHQVLADPRQLRARAPGRARAGHAHRIGVSVVGGPGDESRAAGRPRRAGVRAATARARRRRRRAVHRARPSTRRVGRLRRDRPVA